MARKKDSMALFEVISKSREKRSRGEMGVPEWMGDSEEGGAKQAEASPSQPGTPETVRKPAIVKTDGQLQVTLNYLTCLAIVLGLTVLLAGAFWLGRSTAPEGGEQPAQAGLKMKTDGYRPGLIGQGGGKSSKTGAKQSPMKLPLRQQGKYYLVIESTGGVSDPHLEHARRIQEFCYFQGGEPSEVRKYPATPTTKEQYVVWSLTPFDSPRSTEATQHAEMIEALGAQYFSKYGSYRFQQRKKKDARLDPWFLIHR